MGNGRPARKSYIYWWWREKAAKHLRKISKGLAGKEVKLTKDLNGNLGNGLQPALLKDTVEAGELVVVLVPLLQLKDKAVFGDLEISSSLDLLLEDGIVGRLLVGRIGDAGSLLDGTNNLAGRILGRVLDALVQKVGPSMSNRKARGQYLQSGWKAMQYGPAYERGD